MSLSISLRFIKQSCQKFLILLSLYSVIAGSEIKAWSIKSSLSLISNHFNISNLGDTTDLLEPCKDSISFKNFSIDWDVQSNPEQIILAQNNLYFHDDRSDWRICLSPNISQPLLSHPFLDHRLYSDPFTRSFMRLSAGYHRAQCFVSLGQSNGYEIGQYENKSRLFTGFGFRYQWSDSLAFELGTIVHINPQRPKYEKNEDRQVMEPMSDFTAQVNTLSQPMKSSFAEGLFSIVYYFCNPN